MPKRTIIDHEHASLWYHEEDKIIHHYFKQYTHGSVFRALLSTGADTLIEERATKWLSEDTNNGAIPPEDEEWGNNVWSERVRNAGWKFWAVVPPKKVVGKMNVERFVEWYAERGITVRVFNDADAALAWLKRQ